MNVSGQSVGAAARFFKVPPDALLVVHDDVDLESGRFQIRLGGGLAGHNGLRSIASTLGTQDFLRLRIGVGRPGRGDRRPVADYVLSEFEPEIDVEALVSRAADAVETIAARRRRGRPAALQLTRTRHDRVTAAPTTLKPPEGGWGLGMGDEVAARPRACGSPGPNGFRF